MWTELPQLFTAIPQVFHQSRCRGPSESIPVLVIPLTEETINWLALRVSTRLCQHSHAPCNVKEGAMFRLPVVRRCLATIGIKVPKRHA